MTDLDQRPLLTARQVAERLHLHRNTVKRVIARGELDVYRLGSRGDIRVSEEQLARYLHGCAALAGRA
jgi:excisionase family DNA binding protein